MLHRILLLETQQMTVIMLTDSPESIHVALTSLQLLKGCDSMQGLYPSLPCVKLG